MLRYNWICQVCSATNVPDSGRCATCQSPAHLSAIDIARLRKIRYPEQKDAQIHGPVYTFLSRPSGWLPVTYGVVTLATLAQAAACRGDMCGISGIAAGALLLPWSILSFFAAFLSSGLANATLVLALFANIYALHMLGRRWDHAKDDP